MRTEGGTRSTISAPTAPCSVQQSSSVIGPPMSIVIHDNQIRQRSIQTYLIKLSYKCFFAMKKHLISSILRCKSATAGYSFPSCEQLKQEKFNVAHCDLNFPLHCPRSKKKRPRGTTSKNLLIFYNQGRVITHNALTDCPFSFQ